MSLPDYEGWAMFAAVADAGSFASAAATLGVSPASVSKAVARLEVSLGLTLFHRTTRRVALSTAGADLLPDARAMVAAAAAATESAHEERGVLAGPIRLTAPMSFGIRALGSPLAKFAAAHPDVTLDVMLSDDQCDIVTGGYDLALRIAELPDSSLLSRTVAPVPLALVASPAYLAEHGMPRHPLDLGLHRLIGYGHRRQVSPLAFSRPGESASVTPGGPLFANNGDVMVPMLVAGQGLAVLPEFIVAAELADGRLVRVLTDWSLPALRLQIVMPPGRRRPARVNALVEHLMASLKQSCGGHPLDVRLAGNPHLIQN
ncbi:MAG: LysR family transcriptional regulator [Sphingopyxis sp.]|nr:LysR family transcriptional regulator [Sphingopyxis sp.]